MLVVLAAVAMASSAKAASIPPAVAAAVADIGRPEADRARDANRKPAEVVAFAGVKPGDKVADLLPGGGYYTRIFAKTVGEKGKVYAVTTLTRLRAGRRWRPAGARGFGGRAHRQVRPQVPQAEIAFWVGQIGSS